jgi:PadR family transcriptional regulator, regulatory protein PadR
MKESVGDVDRQLFQASHRLMCNVRRYLHMSRLPLSPALATVLQALVDGACYGFNIIDATGLPSGTVYPALARLEHDSLVASRWEPHRIAQRDKRPPRRYYEVTAAGERRLAEAVAALKERDRAVRAGARGWRPLRTRS